jgi:outer membrane protein OmpA-like peptidoglycan-associated protein
MRFHFTKQCLRKSAISSGLLALALAGGPAHAGNFFVGGTIGQVDIGNYELEAVSTSLDDTDTGYRVFGGWRFNKYFAVGVSYLDLGELQASGDSVLEPNFTDSIEATGYEAWMAAFWPLGERFSLFGTLGAFSWDQDVDYADDLGPFNGSSDGTDLTYGAGVNFAITKHFGMHATYTFYPDVGSIADTGHRNDRDFYGIGFSYLFGDVGEPALAPMAAAAPPPPPPPAAPLPVDSDGDGVVDGSDQCPATPRGERVGPYGCSCDVIRQVNFSSDSAVLTDADKATLDELAATLGRLKFVSGTVEGHTDSTGTDEYNLGLSERRAQAASDYLQSKGIAVGRMKAVGLGESQPVADNSTAEGRAQNRRVVLKRTDCDAR